MKAEIIRVESINKLINEVKVLNNISFNVIQGETLALIGDYSAGKTTLLNIISGLIPYDSGKFYFNESKFNLKSRIEARALGIYLVRDLDQMFDSLTIAENIFLGRETSFLQSLKKLNRFAKEYLEYVNLDCEPSTLLCHLNTSQKALVQLAAVLAANPSLVILDTTSLLSKKILGEELLIKIFNQLNTRNISVIYATNNILDALQFSQRILILRNGMSIGTYETKYCTYDWLQKLINYQNNLITNYTPLPAIENISKEVILELQNINAKKLNNVNLTVYKGEIIGITCLTDSSHSDLLKILYGLQKFTSGKILIDGREAIIKNINSAHKNNISYIPNDNSSHMIVDTMSIKGNITLSYLTRFSMHGWIKNKKEVQFIRQNIPLKFIQDTSLNLPASYLSSGLQKKIQIINRLYSKPKILLWDQPDLTNEINSNVDIKELMEEYIKAGLSVIISSNDIKELSNLCHRIYEFDNGILTESSMYLTI